MMTCSCALVINATGASFRTNTLDEIIFYAFFNYTKVFIQNIHETGSVCFSAVRLSIFVMSRHGNFSNCLILIDSNKNFF